jgi:hypothetical protein
MEDLPKSIRAAIANANRTRVSMKAQGYRDDIIENQYAQTIDKIRAQYLVEMDARIDAQRGKLTRIKARYQDKVKDSLPNALELNLLNQKLSSMTDDQLVRYSEQVRLGNERGTLSVAHEVRALGAECRRRGGEKMTMEADRIALFAEAANVDAQHLSDPDYRATEGAIQKLNVAKMQCEAGQMFVFPSETMEITQKDILPFSKLTEVTE